MKSRDHSNFVLDEVVGMGIAGFSWNTLSPANNWHWSIQILATFILFRIFDILKPPPCRQLDRWSHGHSRLHGVGVMVDDVAAGFYALGVWQVVVAVGALLSGGQ
jgi:phosphatidylglycerophosphatase A